jgi:hypothetical protein
MYPDLNLANSVINEHVMEEHTQKEQSPIRAIPVRCIYSAIRLYAILFIVDRCHLDVLYVDCV